MSPKPRPVVPDILRLKPLPGMVVAASYNEKLLTAKKTLEKYKALNAAQETWTIGPKTIDQITKSDTPMWKAKGTVKVFTTSDAAQMQAEFYSKMKDLWDVAESVAKDDSKK